jgi:hypothetical protein
MLAVGGAGGSGAQSGTRTKTSHKRRQNLQRLAESYEQLSPKDYMERITAIMGDEM